MAPIDCLQSAKANGITKEEIAEILTHATKGGGQMLICVGDRGYYQIEGEPAIEMKAGDVVFIPAGVKHWYGAAPTSWFSHLAFEVPGENSSDRMRL